MNYRRTMAAVAHSLTARCLRTAVIALAVTASLPHAARSQETSPDSAPGTHREVIFNDYGQLARSDELMRRFLTPLSFEQVMQRAAGAGLAMNQQAIDLSKERFLVYVPSGPRPSKGYALMVFVSPKDNASVPYGWTRILDKYGMIFVTAANSGNGTDILQRRNPLAVLGAYNIMQHYPVDAARVYIGGMSGGSRVAMRIALSYPDLFHGVFLDCGSDPIGDIEAPLPSAELFREFQQSTRLVYFTGQNDGINLTSDEGSRQSMRQWCAYGIYDEMMPYVGHEWASQSEFEHALHALDTHAPADPQKLASCRARLDAELNLKLSDVENLIETAKFGAALARLKIVDARFGGLAAPRSVELARQIASHTQH